MRTREEIYATIQKAWDDASIFDAGRLKNIKRDDTILEVLLDIRDLLANK